jgi:hypothetical protein
MADNILYALVFLAIVAACSLAVIAMALWRMLGWLPELVTSLRRIAAALERAHPRTVQELAREQAGKRYRWGSDDG